MYFLSKDCFVCHTQNYWIILSAGRDKYLCVTNDNLTAIGHLLDGWRGDSGGKKHLPQLSAADEQTIAALLSNEIITSNPEGGKPFAESASLPRVSETEISNTAVRERTHPLCVARFLSACTRVDWQLRTKGLYRMLTRLERRRRTCAPAVPVSDSWVLMSAFKELRPWYPRPYLCLFDSLALLEFLASYRAFPRIVFGVVADPFQAHCWLQEGDVVINDSLEKVARYTPILCI
jgi:Transglutaminase-like superfamily